MRISEIYNLKKSQGELDFVDINPSNDLPLFVDPHFLANRQDRWSQESIRTIRSFFNLLLHLLKNEQNVKAKEMFSFLSEPNETCLGLSKRNPQGRGVGTEDTDKIVDSILNSKALISGLVEDLEDCFIFVDNFGKDKLSDMTTNIIRKHLIEYTQSQANLWGISLTPNVQSGPYWDRSSNAWKNEYTNALVVSGKRILLVPKAIVSYCHDYTPSKYHQHFILNFLQDEHLRMDSTLVRKVPRKDGSIRIYVTKKDIKKTESSGSKEDLIAFTEKHPEVFKYFKEALRKPAESLSDREITSINIEEVVDHLISELRATPPGRDDASKYHLLSVGILELLLYPDLMCPQKEVEIHDGRKRIDITFDNAAKQGMFFELHMVHKLPSQYIFVECKNYSGDPANPELDQLGGRFSPNRGRVGLLLCRSIEDMHHFISRCNDTYRDDRGLIIPVTDTDLYQALTERRAGKITPLNDILRIRQRQIQIN